MEEEDIIENICGWPEDTPEGMNFKINIYPTLNRTKYISFDGDDNCENCKGWNGLDRRCDCGNRRVDWCFDYGYWHGQAY